ncbi:S1 family peptidase [Streptantibioticus ferralitis]|uniref:S1 family peptidase n=1 Tax=Streptantibioticus ferralitis TaxID=236510 RepID=A0ABT5Z731_9ACTN|nr:S1 family peptidase [Streptantibioticus ferralitis]MDF2259457.1 S1 family peptidase [Streptantibioticus ferralitis]
MPVRRAALFGAAATALMAATLAPQPASASPTRAPNPVSAAEAAHLASALSAKLKGAAAGSYYDAQTRRLVVNVLDNGSANTVRGAGAEPKLVHNSQARLDADRKALSTRAAIPGTAWVEDPRVNQLVVTADRTVSDENLVKLTEIARSLGDGVTVRRTAAEFRPLIAGGDAIWGSSARCSLGFNVLKGGQPYFLTAGHCGNAVTSWSDVQGGEQIATTAAATFPAHDYALVQYTANVPHPSAVDLYGAGTRPITAAADAITGEAVQRSGSTTGVHSGHVTGLNATVNYSEGSVDGMIQTDVCAEPGDSGGPLFDGATALGLTSGGSGDCFMGGQTFFQPVPQALQAYGAQIGG